MLNPTNLQQAALVTREAHLALLDLKTLVDSAAQKVHAAELEAVGLAVGHSQGIDPLAILRVAADALQSPNFEYAILQARAKTETAVASCLRAQDQ